MPGPVSTWIVRTGKPSRYLTTSRGQLRLAIPLWVVAVSASESWGGCGGRRNRHCTMH